MTYDATPLTTTSRHPERAVYDRDAVHELLDQELLCHVGFVIDGAPRVLPTLFARIGETLYLHGSTAATWTLKARRDGGLPVVVTVTAIDALVLARSQLNHSVNYRSAVAHGVARLVADPEAKATALAALIDKAGPERSGHTRPPDAAELAMTAVFALDLDQVSMKRRTGGPVDDEADLALPHWAGVVPLTVSRGIGRPADGVTAPTPPYVPALSEWRAAPVLAGRHVRLEPLREEHAPELHSALDDAEVWEHFPTPRPRDEAEMAAVVRAAIDDPARTTWAQRLAGTGQLVGVTAYYGVSEAHRQLAIGFTLVGKAWWRTGVNTEAKLLLLARAFDDLGAQRVEWHVDIRNSRSQTAVAGLGAQREGVLRRHRQRPDGSWRDTVLFSMIAPDWPEARDRLAGRLARGRD